MERVIKIRWYDKRQGQIRYDLVTEIEADGSFGCELDSDHREFGGLFTGLTDKNGKEIFEGDIINGVAFHPITKAKIVTHTSLVVFRNGCFYHKHKKDEAYGKMCSTNPPYKNENTVEWCEVIGNIHSNLELLK